MTPEQGENVIILLIMITVLMVPVSALAIAFISLLVSKKEKS